jgi:hypothetical protein
MDALFFLSNSEFFSCNTGRNIYDPCGARNNGRPDMDLIVTQIMDWISRENKVNLLWAPLKIHISSQFLCCGKNFLLTYQPYAALQNFLHALHLGEL